MWDSLTFSSIGFRPQAPTGPKVGFLSRHRPKAKGYAEFMAAFKIPLKENRTIPYLS